MTDEQDARSDEGPRRAARYVPMTMYENRGKLEKIRCTCQAWSLETSNHPARARIRLHMHLPPRTARERAPGAGERRGAELRSSARQPTRLGTYGLPRPAKRNRGRKRPRWHRATCNRHITCTSHKPPAHVQCPRTSPAHLTPHSRSPDHALPLNHTAFDCPSRFARPLALTVSPLSAPRSPQRALTSSHVIGLTRVVACTLSAFVSAPPPGAVDGRTYTCASDTAQLASPVVSRLTRSIRPLGAAWGGDGRARCGGRMSSEDVCARTHMHACMFAVVQLQLLRRTGRVSGGRVPGRGGTWARSPRPSPQFSISCLPGPGSCPTGRR